MILLRVFAIWVSCFVVNVSFAATLSPIGQWKTIDDETSLPRSIIFIQQKDNQLQGRLEKIFAGENENINLLCDKCPGKWHNQKKIGMTLLWGFTQNPENSLQWINGKILDPKTGKIYQCHLTLSENGKELRVRGYVGIPLLGRTQTWLREE